MADLEVESIKTLADQFYKQAGNKSLLNPDDVAHLIGKNPTTFRQYISRGRVNFPWSTKINGGTMMISTVSLAKKILEAEQ